ncbi:hypothetical protein LguiA_015822 [Lonicera macranthoides]
MSYLKALSVIYQNNNYTAHLLLVSAEQLVGHEHTSYLSMWLQGVGKSSPYIGREIFN